MDVNNDEENRILPKIHKNINKHNDDDDDDDELSIDQLQIMINQLNFQDEEGNYPKRLASLQNFFNYLSKYLPPSPIVVQLSQSILQIVQEENPDEINQITLSIINIIYKSFTDSIPVDYEPLVQFLWNMLPSEDAFDALSLISSRNLAFSKIVIQRKDTIMEWLQEPQYITNALNLLNGLIRNKEMRTNFLHDINEFLQLSQTLDVDDLTILYSILMHYAETNEGRTSILDYGMLSTLFDRALDNPNIFYSALCFVENVNRNTRDPILFMEKANVLNFFEKSLNSSESNIFKEGLKLCYSTVESKSGIQYLVENEIVDKLFSFLNSSFEISCFALQIICRIISNSSLDLIQQFLEKNIMDTISLFLPNAPWNCQFEILRCLQTIVNTLNDSGNSEAVLELATNDLEQALSELKDSNSLQDRQLQEIALVVYRMIFPQD